MPTVVFTENNARVVKDPAEMHAMRDWPNAIINPDLKAVDGHPPHFWKVVGGRILPMTEAEQAVRMASISENGVKNAVVEMAAPPVVTSKNKWIKPLIATALVAAAAAYVWVKLHG